MGTGVRGEDMKTFSKDSFEFWEVRRVPGNKGAADGVIMGGLGGPGGMRCLFDYEGWEITSGEKRLGEISSIGVEVIRTAAGL